MDLSAALAQFIRWVMRDVTYHKVYACTVQGQSDDLDYLDVLPDDEKIRGTGLQRVRIRNGLPGVKVQVKTGTRILLGFEDGDPRKPYVSTWGREGALDIILQPDDDGKITIKASTSITVESPNVLLGTAPGSDVCTVGDMLVIPPSAFAPMFAAIAPLITTPTAPVPPAATLAAIATALAAAPPLIPPVIGATGSGSGSVQA